MARLELFARTEVGCVRERNEDAFLVANLQTGHKGLGEGERIQELMAAGGLIGVCDGMGGAAAGDLAAQMATDCLFDVVSRSIPFRDPSGVQAALLQACVTANRTIADHARVHAEKRGMVTTMTAAIASRSADNAEPM